MFSYAARKQELQPLTDLDVYSTHMSQVLHDHTARRSHLVLHPLVDRAMSRNLDKIKESLSGGNHGQWNDN